MDDLIQKIVQELQKRRGSWKEIAEALQPDVSYSMISRLGRGKYESEPSLRKLRPLAAHLGIELVVGGQTRKVRRSKAASNQETSLPPVESAA